MVNERTKVDENMYYRSINKSAASPARRDQTHGLTPPGHSGSIEPPSVEKVNEKDGREEEKGNQGGKDEGPEVKEGPQQPRYLFHNAASLEALTRKHNVCLFLRTFLFKPKTNRRWSFSLPSRNCKFRSGNRITNSC